MEVWGCTDPRRWETVKMGPECDAPYCLFAAGWSCCMTISSPSSNDGVTGGRGWGWEVLGRGGDGWAVNQVLHPPTAPFPTVPRPQMKWAASAAAAHQSEQTATIKSSVSFFSPYWRRLIWLIFDLVLCHLRQERWITETCMENLISRRINLSH